MARIQNPYGYNDPAMASIANNIARMAFAGESPNEEALREATMREKAAATGARHAQGRKYTSEAMLNEQSNRARGPDGIIQYIASTLGADPTAVGNVLFGGESDVDPRIAQRIRDEFRTAGAIPMAGPGTQKINDITAAQFASRQMGDLLMGDPVAEVGARGAAMEGELPFAIQGDTLLNQYTGENQITQKGRMDGSRDTRAPVLTVGPDGKPVFISPSDAIGREAYQKPVKNDPVGEAADLLGLVELAIGINEDNAGQYDPAAVQLIFDDAWNNYQKTGNPTSAVTQAIQKNQLTDYEEGGWFSDEKPRTINRLPAPEQAAANPATAPIEIPPPDRREVGKVYQTPKGPMEWRGQGWRPVGQ